MRAARLTAALLALLALATACSPAAGKSPAAGRAPLAPPSATPAAPVAYPPGGPVLGVKWDWDRAQAYGPFLQGFPGGDTFYELVWCDIEPQQGAQDWSRIDQVVDGAARLGFRMDLKIRIGSCWAAGRRLDSRGKKSKTASLPPADIARYRAFVRTVVTRYAPKGVHRFAIENEINGEGFWAGTPEDYQALARAASAEIHSADPKAVVLDGGISSTAYGEALARWLLDQGRGDEAVAAYQRYYDRRFDVRGDQLPRVNDVSGLRAALQTDQAVRNLAFLDATQALVREGVFDAYQLHFYERWDNVPLLLDFLHRQLPAGFPIESWETGDFWPKASGDLDVIAGETAKTVALLVAGGVRTVIWLPAAHDPGGRKAVEDRWGLFDADGTPRLSAGIFRDVASAGAGATVRSVAVGPVRGVALGRGNNTFLLVWSDTSARLAGPGPTGAAVQALDGRAQAWGSGGLDVGEAPLVIRVPAPLETTLGALH
jgi:hypothetical protein